MAVEKVRCPHCGKDHYVDVQPAGRTGKIAVVPLDDEESLTRRLVEVVESVLERHNGNAPLSIISIEASRRGIPSADIRRLLKAFVADGRYRVDRDTLTW